MLDIILLPYDRHASIRIMKQTKSYFMIDVFNRKFLIIEFPFEIQNKIYEIIKSFRCVNQIRLYFICKITAFCEQCYLIT